MGCVLFSLAECFVSAFADVGVVGYHSAVVVPFI